MEKRAFVKRVVVGGGFLCLFATPMLSFGQSSAPAAAPGPLVRPVSGPRRGSTPPPDLLTGLTLTDDQKVKIDAIREGTKSQLAAVTNAKQLSPETVDAMLRGYQRIENSKIFEVLTLEQQVQVRKRMAAWKAAERQPKQPSQQAPVPETTPQPK
jgi:hypothetical protein